MGRLFIAEKASLGRAIAEALPGLKVKKPSHIECDNGDVVTWASGHLIEQVDPLDYNSKWKTWTLASLPITVQVWKLRPVTIKSSKPTAEQKSWNKSNLAQLAAIEALMKKADVIVNAGDPDREGQLIVDELISYFGQNLKPQLRIWLNALDIASAKKALACMEDNKAKKYRNLNASAECRQRADWLVGMNMTRAVTKAIAQGDIVASIGRVQTPTLALVVNRCIDVENFTSKSFFELEVDVATASDVVTLSFSTTDTDKRIWDKKIADSLAASLKGAAVKLSVISAEKSSSPPPLFHLPDFQKFAGKNLKWKVAKSLEVLQNLYEAKLTTYPRTESNKLPPEQEPDGLPIAKGLLSTGMFDPVKKLPLATRKSVYSCSKDESHHAVVPTSVVPSKFPDSDCEIAWKIIAARFLMSLMPSYRFTETVVSIKEQHYVFSTKGEIPLIPAANTWMALAGEKGKTLLLPPIKDGAQGVVKDVRVLTKKTSPPDYYTEATLLEDMRSVAKFVSNEKLKAILKETSGIGRPATQALIIDLIQNKGYVQKVGDKLKDTPFGRSLIQSLPVQLKDPGLTAAWEDALKMIAAGTYVPEEFMKRIDVFIQGRIKDVTALQGKVILSADKSASGKAEFKSAPTAKAKVTSKAAPKQKSTKKSEKPSHKGGLSEF